MLRWMFGITKLDGYEMKENGDKESGGNLKENPGKEFEVVWACDAKKGGLRRKHGDGNGSSMEEEERQA